MDTRYPDIRVNLTGESGNNPFVTIANVQRALRNTLRRSPSPQSTGRSPP